MATGVIIMRETGISAALIGAGMISLYHLRAWTAAGVPVVAVCDTDIGKARALLGYDPTTSLYDGIGKAVQWSRKWQAK